MSGLTLIRYITALSAKGGAKSKPGWSKLHYLAAVFFTVCQVTRMLGAGYADFCKETLTRAEALCQLAVSFSQNAYV